MSVFIVAEVGSNWVGGHGETLIDLAAAAGADAVKFQFFRGETTYAAGAGPCQHLTEKGIGQDIREVFRKLEMPEAMVAHLAAYCQEKGMEFMASCFSEADFAVIDPHVKRHKIASPELHHPRLLELAARSRKPTYLSTGMSTEEEIQWAIGVYEAAGGEDLTLMQCTVAYPTPLESVNIRAIDALARFGRPLGLSDHSRHPIVAPVMAVALGASVIEKHFTLHNLLPGPDHCWAITGEELKEMCGAIRLAEKMAGSAEKRVDPAEESLVTFSKRGLHAIAKIEVGDLLQEGKNVGILRSGRQRQGVHARLLDQVEGQLATRCISIGEGVQVGDWS